ncbi:MAG: hypothetical protein NZL96_03535 [Patescibacteria group bacterium]|nr:hypothetical protein [Patescibacteria group bacterium]
MTKLKSILKKLRQLKSPPPPKKNFLGKALGDYLLKLGFFLFLVANVIASQSVNNLIIDLVKLDEEAIIRFLKKIKTQDEYFFSQLAYFENLTQKSLREIVFEEETNLEKTRQRLESALEKNPNSPEVLYALSLIYQKKENHQKANEYREKAKNFDPKIEKRLKN